VLLGALEPEAPRLEVIETFVVDILEIFTIHMDEPIDIIGGRGYILDTHLE